MLPGGKLAEQIGPQLMPAGELVTVPLPVPCLYTCNVGSCPPGCSPTRKAAMHVVLALSDTVPVVQAGSPLQPAKEYPLSGAALRVTTVFGA